MSPKAADPAVRTALLENAARLIATEGAGGLTLRRLAEATGTSTMAVYTHFGGMQSLRDEVRREGFARLRAHLDFVEATNDPVADLARLGREYHDNARENPHLYRAMFMEPAPIGNSEATDDDIGLDTFDLLVAGVRRCMDTGRFSPADPVPLALQLWSAAHGVMALVLSGLLEDDLALATLDSTWRNLFLASGDDPARLDRSLARARRAGGAPVGRPSTGRFDARHRG
ncbi:MAG TPA: TetR/AcrR family transcriptional regulator [Sporichthyaceae bacterium]